MTRGGESMHETAHRSCTPVVLQEVFMASNRGENVVEPPTERAAYKVFSNNWVHQQKTRPAKKCLNMESNEQANERSTVGPELMDTQKVRYQ